MVSVVSFKSFSIQHDVHFVNHGPIYFKIDDKAAYTLGRGYLVIDMSCSAIEFMDVELKDTPRSQLPVSTLCFKPDFHQPKLAF